QHLYIIDSVHILILHLSPFLSYHFHSTTPQPTQIYTLSLHDALPILDSLCSETIAFICSKAVWSRSTSVSRMPFLCDTQPCTIPDRKSTRLNSSHVSISYAVFCLKKKKGGIREGREATWAKIAWCHHI